MKVNSGDIFELYECIVNGYYGRYPEYEKYSYYFELFFHNFNRDLNYLRVLIEILDRYKEDIDRLDREFFDDLIIHDKLQLGLSTGDPILALGILCNRKIYKFDYNYSKVFKILFATCKEKHNKIFKNINRYYEVYESIRNIATSEISKGIDTDYYRNYQFNCHILINYAISYAYYMNYEPEKVKDIVEYFVKNYEQLINNFDVNGLTREDLVISKTGLDYYMGFYDRNNDRQELKSIK